MAPRKSATTSRSRPSTSASAMDIPPQPIAGPSKPTIPTHGVLESLTPGYEPPTSSAKELDEEERGRMVYELVGFHPRTMLEEISEKARQQIYVLVDGIDAWAQKMVEGRSEEEEREVTIGLHALETLLESHVDIAFDRFTSWALRNTFEIQPNLEPVLPWQKGLDFDRAIYVTENGGEEGLSNKLEDLRTRVEQARLLQQRLELAESRLDRRLEIARQRKAEVGFVKEIIDSSELNPLPTNVTNIQNSLSTLQTSLQTLQTLPLPLALPQPTSSNGGTRAWELGRQSYLNWAVHKMLAQGAVPEADSLMEEGGMDVEGMERLAAQAV